MDSSHSRGDRVGAFLKQPRSGLVPDLFATCPSASYVRTLYGYGSTLQTKLMFVRVGGDDEVAVGPLGVFISAEEKFQGELFELVVVEDLEVRRRKESPRTALGSVMSNVVIRNARRTSESLAG